MRRLRFLTIRLTWLLSLLVAFSLAGESWALSRGGLPLAELPATINDGGSLILAQMRGKPVAKPKRSFRPSAAPRTTQPRLKSTRPPTPHMSKPQIRMPRVTLPNLGRRSSLSGRPSSRQALLSGGARSPRMLPGRGRVANGNIPVRFKIKPQNASAGLRRTAPPPRVALAGSAIAKGLPPRVAANGIGSKQRAVNDNRGTGNQGRLRNTRGNVGAQSGRPLGSSGAIRASAIGNRLAILQSNRGLAGSIGYIAKKRLLSSAQSRNAITRLQARIDGNILRAANKPKSVLSRDFNISSFGWPKNDGFLKTPKNNTLPVGHRIDRYGHGGGHFASPKGTPFEKRSLPRGTEKLPLTSYQVMKPLPVQSGIAAPWFGSPGLGTQYKFRKSIDELVSSGYLKKI